MSDTSKKSLDFQTLSTAIPAATGTRALENINGQWVAALPDGSYAGLVPKATDLGIGQDGRVKLTVPSNGTINLCGDSLTNGNLYAGVNNFQHSMFQRFIAYVNHQYICSGLKPPTFVNSAVGGQSSANMLANVIGQCITPAVDGSDIFIQIGSNDAGLNVTSDDYARNIRGILTAITAPGARPNSRIHLLGSYLHFTERWQRTGANLVAIDTVGLEGKDALMRRYDDQMRQIATEYTNCRYYDIYEDFLRWASRGNPANLAAVASQDDSVHPGLIGGEVFSQILFTKMDLGTRGLPRELVPVTNADFNEGDWFKEQREWAAHISHGFGRYPVFPVFNRTLQMSFGATRFPTTTPGGSTAAANVTDAGVDGGGYSFATTGLAFCSTIVFTTPKTAPFEITFQGSVNALAANRVILFGLADSTAGGGTAAAPAGDAFLFGIDQAFDAAKFVIWEVRAGAVTKVATTLNADTANHTIHMQMNGIANDGNPGPRYGVFVDGQFVKNYQQASANFPQNPVAVAVGYAANGGVAVLRRAIVMFNEAITAAVSPDGR